MKESITEEFNKYMFSLKHTSLELVSNIRGKKRAIVRMLI